MPTRSISRRATLAAAILLPQTAIAQSEPVFTLDTIFLSAAGVATDPLTAPASVTVITAEQLRTSGITDLTQALREVPGVAVAGGADGQNIFMRGMPSEYTLLLIDGRRISTRQSRTNAAGGVDQFFMPPVAAIERIEIVRGPMSSLYGSDAMGGVINIITRPVASEWTGSFTAEVTVPESDEDSSQRHYSFYLSGPLMGDRLGLQLWGRSLDRSASQQPRGPGDRELQDLSARLTWAIDGETDVYAEHGRTRIDTDPRLNARTTTVLGYDGVIGGWNVEADLSRETASRETDGSLRRPEIVNTILNARGSQAFSWNGTHDLTLGLQVFDADLTDFNPGLADNVAYSFSNLQWALFAEDLWEIAPGLTVTSGLRYTEDERFGGELTPRVYAVWEVADGVFLTGGVAGGYLTPELRQSVAGYYLTTNRGRAVIEGTPTLRPEESTSYEIGLRYQTARMNLTATAFHTDLKNRIESRDTGRRITLNGTGYDLFEYYNVGRAEVRGLELSGEFEVTPDLQLTASYTYTDSERLTNETGLQGLPLARTPDHQASLRLDWQTPIDSLELWASAAYTGDSISISSTGRGLVPNTHQGYTTVDLGAAFAINDSVALRAAVHNVGDVSISDAVHGTVINGRTLRISLTTEF